MWLHRFKAFPFLYGSPSINFRFIDTFFSFNVTDFFLAAEASESHSGVAVSSAECLLGLPRVCFRGGAFRNGRTAAGSKVDGGSRCDGPASGSLGSWIRGFLDDRRGSRFITCRFSNKAGSFLGRPDRRFGRGEFAKARISSTVASHSSSTSNISSSFEGIYKVPLPTETLSSGLLRSVTRDAAKSISMKLWGSNGQTPLTRNPGIIFAGLTVFSQTSCLKT